MEVSVSIQCDSLYQPLPKAIDWINLVSSVLLAGEVIHDVNEYFFDLIETLIVIMFQFAELLTLFIQNKGDNPVSCFKNLVAFMERMIKLINSMFQRRYSRSLTENSII